MYLFYASFGSIVWAHWGQAQALCANIWRILLYLIPF